MKAFKTVLLLALPASGKSEVRNERKTVVPLIVCGHLKAMKQY